MKTILFALLVVLSLAVPVSAQTYLTNTTLSAAVAANPAPGQTIVVASATNFEVGGAIFIDHELMDIIAVSGTRITVSRTQRPVAHNSGAVVYVATKAQRSSVFVANESFRSLSGSCTLGSGRAAILPIFDVTVTGNYAFCEYEASGATARVWRTNNVQGLNGTGSLRTAWP